MTLTLKQYWKLLAQYIAPQRLRFGLLALLLLGNIALQIQIPQIMRRFIDSALGGAPMNQLVFAAVLFLGIALINQGAAVAVTYLSETLAWNATNALRADLAWHCLNLDMGYHNQHTPGELIERIDGDVSELANFFSQFVVILVGNFLLVVGILAALFLEDWRTGLAFLVFAAGSLFTLYRIRNIALVHRKDVRQAQADLFGFIEEQLAGTEDIRSSGAVDHSLVELQRLQSNIFKHDRLAQRKEWYMDIAMDVLIAVAIVLAVGSGYMLYTAGLVTIGTAYLFIRYVNLLEAPLWTLTHEVRSFQTIGACLERLTELLNQSSKVIDGSEDGLPRTALGLEFDGVTFAYNGNDPVLRDVSFKLKPGTVLGLLGRTGSGKTTLTRLIFRLYDPGGGRVLLGGKELNRLNLQSLRAKIGLVTQDVQLFQASVRDNLTFFDRRITDEKITAVLTDLGLGDWLQGLPDGLDTVMESGGRSLSAGEAQLLALVRVFLRDPGLVILDEASSRLDPATEQLIERAINQLLKGRTALVIAHRLGTVHRADDILILEDGRVGEYGKREALARDSESRFYQLLQTGLEEVLV